MNTAADVVCVGDAFFDMLADDFDVPKEQVKSWTPKAGGAVCNVATGLAKLGVAISFVAVIGDDAYGQQLLTLLDEVGVQMGDIKQVSAPTRDVYITRTSNGEREFSGFGGPSDQFADCFIEARKLPIRKIQTAKVLVSGTLGQAFDQTGEAIRTAVSVARSAGVCVMLDVNWRPVFFKDPTVVKDELFQLVSQADLVKLTNEEAEWMFGIDQVVALKEPNRVLDCLPGTRGVMVTAGPDGAAYCFKTKAGLHSGFAPAFTVSVVDTTGAGDAFTSGFIYCMLKSGGIDGLLSSPETIDSAIEFASASGAVTVSALGAVEAQPTSPAVVQKLIQTTRSL